MHNENNSKVGLSSGKDEIIFGKNAVAEALAAGRTPDAVLVKPGAKEVGFIVAKSKALGAVVKEVSLAKLDEMAAEVTNGRHGGIAAIFRAVSYVSVEEILAVSAEKGKAAFILMLAGIEDPRNLGALIRTAEAAGVDGVIIPERRSAGLSPAVYSSSAGAINHIKICRVKNLIDTVKKLKKKGVWVYGAEADGTPFREVDFTGGACLVIGGEDKGVGRLLRENCDFMVSVDMYGKVNSLNASVCGGILMYHIRHAKEHIF